MGNSVATRGRRLISVRTRSGMLPTAAGGDGPAAVPRQKGPEDGFQGVGHAHHAEVGRVGAVGGAFVVVAQEVLPLDVVKPRDALGFEPFVSRL